MLGKLSDARYRYMKLSAQYETEQAEIGRLANALEQEIESEAGQVADVGRIPLSKPEPPEATEEPA